MDDGYIDACLYGDAEKCLAFATINMPYILYPKFRRRCQSTRNQSNGENCRNEYWTQYMNPVKLLISSNILGLCTYYHRVLIVIIPIYKLTIRLCKYTFKHLLIIYLITSQMISLLMKTEYQIKRIQLLIRSAILAQENKIPSSMYLFFYN